MIDSKEVERRITLRLLSYWEKLRRGRAMPTEEDINPDDLMDLWDHCFLVHTVDLSKPDYHFIYLGDAIVEAFDTGHIQQETETAVLADAVMAAMNFPKVVESGKPLLDEGEFTNIVNETVKYRQCLLPLGQGDKIEAIFGGMSFKIFAS